jgi:hypothetical protein
MYTSLNFEQIAGALGISIKHVSTHAKWFETAALWCRLNRERPDQKLGRIGRPKRIAPSKLHRKLSRVAANARRLLKSLGLNNFDEAADGPAHRDILNFLVLSGEPSEDPAGWKPHRRHV